MDVERGGPADSLRRIPAHSGLFCLIQQSHKRNRRPVLVLTRDPVASRIGAVVVAAFTRTERGLVSRERDGVPTDCVVSFDNLHTVPRESLRRRVTRLGAPRIAEACRALRDALGCWR